MEVKVGIRNVQREVSLETKATAAALEEQLAVAIASGGVFALTDDKGRKVLIPAQQIAYVDLGSEHTRPVGFGAVTA